MIVRKFNEPIRQLWGGWTEIESLQAWWGRPNAAVGRCTLDFRRGGVFHYSLCAPDSTITWGRWVFTEVVPGRRLAFITAFSDAEGDGPVRHGRESDWPLEIHMGVHLQPVVAATRLVLRWTPVNPTEREYNGFMSAHADYRQGWMNALDRFAAFLATPAGQRAGCREAVPASTGGHEITNPQERYRA